MTQQELEFYNKFKVIFSQDGSQIERYYEEFNLQQYFIIVSKENATYRLKSSSIRLIEAEVTAHVEQWIHEYRQYWKNTLPGKIGDKNACIEKMVSFLINTRFEYTKDAILKAAEDYISDTTSYKYLQQADYFIYKKTSGITSSRLLTYLEESENQEAKSSYLGDSIV